MTINIFCFCFHEYRMVYGGRGGNDAHSAFSVSRSASTTKMPDMSKLQVHTAILNRPDQI